MPITPDPSSTRDTTNALPRAGQTQPGPFTDHQLLQTLYADVDRLARRTSTLHAAKISGPDATTTIADLAARVSPRGGVVCDIGCGRGTSTLALAARLAPRRLIALDRSMTLLDTVQRRAASAGCRVDTVCADFHELAPIPIASIDLAVAAFCLYHSLWPERVVAAIGERLTPSGHAVLVTKSADSYHEIDQLVASSELDPDAVRRPSLYATFHTANAETITATELKVERVIHQEHRFRFSGLDHVADYLSTSPKYRLPANRLSGRIDATPGTGRGTEGSGARPTAGRDVDCHLCHCGPAMTRGTEMDTAAANRSVFVKVYSTPTRAAAARAHRDWLAALNSGVRLPALRAATPLQLEFEHLGHRAPGPEDLVELARVLGLVHAAAHLGPLRTARLDTAYCTTTPVATSATRSEDTADTADLVIADFPSSRRAWLARLPVEWEGLPAAVYKDANIRNFVLTDSGAAMVDFDDLTLAPMGYDLAKLVVSAAMIHGRIAPETIAAALDAYNAETGADPCPEARLRRYAEFHHVCTVRYLHPRYHSRNGYRHAWPDVRPWTAPTEA